MKRVLTILILVLMAFSGELSAVAYQQLSALSCQPSADFSSTSGYLAQRNGSGATSALGGGRGESIRLSTINIQPSTSPAPRRGAGGESVRGRGVAPMGPSAISASNFKKLNSEGGACYNPGQDRRKSGRPGGGDDGSGAIGEYDFHSPIGNTPWLLILLMSIGYILRKTISKPSAVGRRP